MKPSLPQWDVEPFCIEREWESEGIPILSATVSIPHSTASKNRISRRITRFYHLQAHAFLRYCEHWLLPKATAQHQAAISSSAPLPHMHVQLNYQITYLENALWSLYTQSCEPDASGETLYFRHGDTWDLSTGYPVTLSSFFPPRTRWKTHLLALVAQQIQAQEHTGTTRYYPEWHKLLRRHFNPRNYYLTPKGIIIFFPMCAIAPPSEEIPTFLLPYSENLILPFEVHKKA